MLQGFGAGVPLIRPPGSIPQGIPQVDPNDPINVGLIGLYIPGLLAQDVTGRHTPLTLNGGFSRVPTPDGNSILFDGSSGYAALGTYSGLGSSSRSFVCTWATASAPTSSAKRVFTFPLDDTTTDEPAATLSFVTSGVVGGFGGNPFNGYITGPTVSANVVYTSALSISGQTVSFYHQGKLIGSATNSGPVASSPIGYIGRYNSAYGQYGNVWVAILRIYQRPLVASEIFRLTNDTWAGLPSDRVPLWAPSSGSVSVNLTGVSAAAAVASFLTEIDVPFTGVAAASGVANFLSEIDIPFSGVAAAAGVGSFVAEDSVEFTGVSASAGVESFAIEEEIALSAVMATATVGSFVAEEDISFTAISAIGAVAAFLSEIDVSLTPVVAAGAVAAFAVSVPLTVLLTAVAAIGVVGSFTVVGPKSGQSPQSGFISNVGRMMFRRG